MRVLFLIVRLATFGLVLFTASEAAGAAEQQVCKFSAARRINVQGRDHLVVIAQPMPAGKSVRLVIPNADPAKYDPKPELAAIANGFKQGDLMKAEYETQKSVNLLGSLAAWSPKTGEETPNGYVFVESHPKAAGSTDLVLVLSKYEQPLEIQVHAVGDAHDGLMSGTEIAETLQHLNKGDVVWAQVSSSKSPVLLALAPYAEAKPGKLIRLDPAVVDGHKGFAVNIDSDGKNVTCLIPGRAQNKNWVSDPRLMAAVHRFHGGSEVLFRTRDSGDKTFLLDIEAPPKPPAQVARPTRGGNAGAGIPARTGGPVSLPPIGLPGGF